MTSGKLTLKYFLLTFPPCPYLSFLKWNVKGKGQQCDCYMRAWRKKAFHRGDTAGGQSGEREPESGGHSWLATLHSPAQPSGTTGTVWTAPVPLWVGERVCWLFQTTCHLLSRVVRIIGEMVEESENTVFLPRNHTVSMFVTVFRVFRKPWRVLKR